MSTQLDVCNLALLRLGQGRIASINEGSKESDYCLQFWDADRKAALRDFPWSFSTSDPTGLTLLDGKPIDFAYAYQLPTDCLRALSLYDSNTLQSFPPGDFGREAAKMKTLLQLMLFEVRKGRKLVTNLANAALVYTVNITDATQFDDQFVEALSYRLAIDLALPITGNAQFANTMASLYKSSMLAARTSDAKEARRVQKVGRSFLDSRK